jgi:pimeloyl-ACP methyl ester carboxylesterase
MRQINRGDDSLKGALRALFIALSLVSWSEVSAQPSPLESGLIPGEVPIHYQIHGRKDGIPVLVIHYFGGYFDAGRLEQLIERLRDYQVIGMDVRGHGRSAKPTKPEEYGLMLVEDVNRLLDHLGVKNAHIIGLSMGGIIGLKHASLYPDRVRSLTLGGQGLVPAASFDQWVAMGQAVLAAEKRTPAQESNLHIYSGLLRGYPPLRVTEAEAQELKIPVLSVIGEQDERLSLARHLKQVYPATTLIVAPGYNHPTILAKDSPFYMAVDGFLRQLETR